MSFQANIASRFISVWDGGIEIETPCTINMESGNIYPEIAENGVEQHVSTLDSQRVMLGAFSVEVVDDNGQLRAGKPAELKVLAQFAQVLDELPCYVELDSFVEHGLKQEANTLVCYQYRCASNWKDTNEVIFKGVITPEQIQMIEQSFLPDFEPEDFLPRQVGLRPLCPWTDDENYDDELDHMIHTLESIRIVDAPATDPLSIVDLANKFAAAKSDSWDMVKFGNERYC